MTRRRKAKVQEVKLFQLLEINLSTLHFGSSRFFAFAVFLTFGSPCISDTENLVADACLKLWNAVGLKGNDENFSNIPRVSVVARLIAHQVLIDFRRSQRAIRNGGNRKRIPLEPLIATLADSKSSQTVGDDSRYDFTELSHRFGDEDLAAIFLAMIKGKTRCEIAMEMNLPVSRVRNQIRKLVMILERERERESFTTILTIAEPIAVARCELRRGSQRRCDETRYLETPPLRPERKFAFVGKRFAIAEHSPTERKKTFESRFAAHEDVRPPGLKNFPFADLGPGACNTIIAKNLRALAALRDTLFLKN